MKGADNLSLTGVLSFSLDARLGGRFYCADAFLATYSALTWHLIATQSLQRVRMLRWPCLGGPSYWF